MSTRVYKFGGASLSDLDKVQAAAAILKKEKQQHGQPMIIIVSAMGDTTDHLISLAQKVSSTPKKRELDMLLTAGERISMSLMSICLNELGVPAVSFTGSQAGIITDGSHGNANIVEVKPFRLEAHIKNDDVIVLAGFQGVSKDTKEVTTLGRGGTDTTAIAMAAHFKSELCEFKKDVDGIYSADPKLIPYAKHLPILSHQNVLDMSFWGGNFLHYKAAELAKNLNVPLSFSHFQGAGKSTSVDSNVKSKDLTSILAINSHKHLNEVRFTPDGPQKNVALLKRDLQILLDKHHFPSPQIVMEGSKRQDIHLFCTGDLTELEKEASLQIKSYSSVTITCEPNSVSEELTKNATALIDNIDIKRTHSDGSNLTFIVNPKDRDATIKALHALID